MNTISLKCSFCKQDFNKDINQYNRAIKYKKNNFCSLSCSAKFNIIQVKEKSVSERTKYLQNPIKCKVCSSIIEYEHRNIKKFCSQSCSSIFNNKIRIRNVKKKTNNILNCLYCGKAGIRKKYCSSQCQGKESQKHTNLKIESGNKVGPVQFKRYLSEKRGHKCEMCSLTEWGGKPILLILDHIDGNSDNCCLKNLRLICSNCDTLTPTYKGRNKGNGRFIRRKKYAQGLSY